MNVQLENNGLRLQVDGVEKYFNYFWLRDNCPGSFDPITRERVFDICTLDDRPIATFAEICGDKLKVRWSNSDSESEFEISWLRQHGSGRIRQDSAHIERVLWRAGHQIDRFEKPDLVTNRANKLLWAKSLLEDGISLVSGMQDSDGDLTELASLLGTVRSSVAGDYFDVRVKLDPENLSYTDAALELHTDTPAEELPPGIQFLHCRKNRALGGESIFVDGVAVASDFRDQFPDHFELLCQIKIPFFYEHEEFDWRSRQRVIELDDNDQISGVTISRHMADVIDIPQRLLDSYYPAYYEFGRKLLDRKYQMRFQLNEGECIVFDNHRVVHGRESYEAGTGERYLRGCYIDRGELRSTFRTLKKHLDQ